MIQYSLPMDQVSEVREKTDLPSLISEYISLKKFGRNFKANCPFHQEKTPSFVVSPERQIWHCFGCGKGGDAFTFLMEYENMEFVEALRFLAKKVGVTLKNFGFQKGAYSQKENIYKLNSLASKFYNFLLTKHPIGKTALEYLIKKRDLNLNLINSYSLGFSPSDNSLSKYFTAKKGHKKEELLDSGLSYVRNGKTFDFFRNRIMFPLSDHRGNIVGFSGRALSDNDQPKYINTRDTLVYHKGSLFFGLESAKEEIKKKDSAIIVEGEFDALSSFKEGIKNVVAIKGTALTENQANLLSRFTKKVILCLDQDEAGFEATKRSLSSLEKNDFTIDVLILDDKDPDEALRKSPAAFKKALKNSVGVYDFIISKSLKSNNSQNVDGKRKITQEILPLVSQISNEVVKEHYLKKLSKDLDTSYESLIREIEKIQSAKKEASISVQSQPPKKGRRELLEEFYLSVVLQNGDPKELIKDRKDFLLSYEFENRAIKRIFEAMRKYFQKSEKFNIKSFARNLPKELLPIFDESFLFPLSKFDEDKLFEKYLEKAEFELLDFNKKSKIIEQASKLN